MGVGDDTWATIQWFVAPPNALTFLGPTCFRSLDTWDGLGTLPRGPGPQRKRKWPYSLGETPPGYTGDGSHVCTPDGLGQQSPMWLTGLPSPPGPPINTDPNGVPDCCTGNRTGAVAFTGRGSFAPTSAENPMTIAAVPATFFVDESNDEVWYVSAPVITGASIYFLVASAIQPNVTGLFLYDESGGPFAGPFISGNLYVWFVGPHPTGATLINLQANLAGQENRVGWTIDSVLAWQVTGYGIPITEDLVQVREGSGQVADSGVSVRTRYQYEAAFGFTVGVYPWGLPLEDYWTPGLVSGISGVCLASSASFLTENFTTLEISAGQANAAPWIAGIITVVAESGGMLAIASFGGRGSFAPAAMGLAYRSAGFSGRGTFAASSPAIVTGAAAFSGTGTFSAAGESQSGGAAAFTGSGTFTASGGGVWNGSASFSGTGTFAAGGARQLQGYATFTGTGTFSPAGALQIGNYAAQQTNTVSATANGTSITITPVNSTPSGALGVVVLVGLRTSGSAAITVTPPSGWATISTMPVEIGGDKQLKLYIFYNLSLSSGFNSYTFTQNGTSGGFSALYVEATKAGGWSNVATQTTTGTGGTTYSITNQTAGLAVTLSVGGVGSDDSNTWSPSGTGQASLQAVNATDVISALCSYTTADNTLVGYSGTLSASASWAAGPVMFS
jgi:hypothetical protein